MQVPASFYQGKARDNKAFIIMRHFITSEDFA